MRVRPQASSRISTGVHVTTTKARRLATGLLLGAAGVALAGCSGPTYGTGVSQSGQLFNDLDGVFALGNTNRQDEVSYAPRPELVRPAAIGQLPPPRPANVAAQDPNWPQSPEVIRARRLAAAESTRGDGLLPADYNPSTGTMAARNPDAVSPINDAAQDRSWLSPADLRGQRRQAREQRVTAQSNPTQRRYLSDPPIAYRQPVASAPVGDVGIDEEVKARRATGTRSLGSRIREAMPF